MAIQCYCWVSQMLGVVINSIMLCVMLNVVTPSILLLSTYIKQFFISWWNRKLTLSIHKLFCNIITILWYYAECHVLFNVMLNVPALCWMPLCRMSLYWMSLGLHSTQKCMTRQAQNLVNFGHSCHLQH